MIAIEEQRAQAVSKLVELEKIRRPTYSARELHQRRAMLARGQRREQKRHMKQVMVQKVKLRKDITDMDRYLQSVSDCEAYLASLQQEPLDQLGEPSVAALESIPTPIVLSAPNIVFGARPILRRTRLQRYKRRGKY